jgi:probable rRNA maturation factor
MSLTLAWNNDQEAYDIPESWITNLEALLMASGEAEGIQEGEVALTFVDDETIHQLNQQYRGIDRATDVLSFAMNETTEDEVDISFDDLEAVDEAGEPCEVPELLGDIIISVPTAKRQSEEYNHSLEREIGFLFVHGFLHLIGYDHGDTEAEKVMFSKQEAILLRVGLTR